MLRRSFLHPHDAYRGPDTHKTQQPSTIQTPDIFVVPPEEDQIPPWCCYNSQSGPPDEDEDDHTLRYPQASQYTPYFHRDAHGFDSLIMPSRKGASETRSIVDALGDADDDSDNDLVHDGTGMYLEEDEDEDDNEMVSELGRNHGRVFHHPRGLGSLHQPPSPQKEDNDSDVVEIVKVRRKSSFIADDPDFFGPSGSGFQSNGKSTLRSRATKALQSFKGSLRGTSKITPKFTDSGPSHEFSTKPRPSLQLRAKSLSRRTKVQDVFSPIENIPDSERSQTPGLSRRPSKSLSQFFSPALKRRASSNSITTSTPAAPPPQTQTPSITKDKPQLSHISTTPRCSSPNTQGPDKESTSEADDVSTPTRKSHERFSEDDQSTPSWRTHGARDTELGDPPKPRSPTPPRSDSPPQFNRSARKFSVLSLHKLFTKSGARNAPRPPDQVPSNSSAASTCPSLSSTPTSEWSGRTSPTLDSIPQTPTSFDENETRRTIVPVESCSTVGSGMSLGSSLQSAAISSWSSGSISCTATATTHGSMSSHCGYHPSRPNGTTLSSTTDNTELGFLYPGTSFDTKLPRPSIFNSHSAGPTSIAGSANYISSNRGSESTIFSPLEGSQAPDFDISLKLDIDLDLGLGINLSPSASGGILSSNNMKRPMINNSTFYRRRRGTSVSSSLSLKSLGSRLGIGKQEVPPLPPLPQSRRGSAESGERGMRLNSMHFEDISFDVDNFITHLND